MQEQMEKWKAKWTEAAFGKREQLSKSLSEEAAYEAANVLAARGAK